MTPDTEQKMLELLASIDARLKSIEEVTEMFRGRMESMDHAQETMQRIRETPRR